MARIDRLEVLVEQFQSFAVLKKESEAQLDAIKGEIKQIMDAEGYDEYFADSAHVVYKEVTSHPIDSALLKKELPEIAERYTLTRTTKPLKVL
jgi:predicted phage-related endonuclease